jgi:hypothetical protein
MRRRSEGQSLVEMALMLPLLLMILFGIVDIGYYIYGFSTIYEAARNGTERASQLAPFKSTVGQNMDVNDPCVAAILDETAKGAVLFPNIKSYVSIQYPNDTRELGQPIEVDINYPIDPLTPLFRFVSFGNKGQMMVRIAAQRTVESMGNGPPTPGHENGVVCSGHD